MIGPSNLVCHFQFVSDIFFGSTYKITRPTNIIKFAVSISKETKKKKRRRRSSIQW